MWQLVKILILTDHQIGKNLPCSLKHSPCDWKTGIKRNFTIKEGWNSKWLQNFFFIVKLNFKRYVASSPLKPCQNLANKWFVQNNLLRWLWGVKYRCSDLCWCYLRDVIRGIFLSDMQAGIPSWISNYALKEAISKYQIKAFVICDLKSDRTRSATHINKTYPVWLMY